MVRDLHALNALSLTMISLSFRCCLLLYPARTTVLHWFLGVGSRWSKNQATESYSNSEIFSNITVIFPIPDILR